MAFLLKLNEATLGYGHTPLLGGISFSVEEGDSLAIVGPNGAGKSTLLFTALGMIPPLAGTVERKRDLSVGYVPQRGRHDPLFPFRVLDVVAMGSLGQSAQGHSFHFAPPAKARAALAELGVEDLALHPFRSLSGGQQQRVLIARALVRSPQLLVLDEPTAGMDLPSERDLMALIASLPKSKPMAVIFVTHELTLAAGHAKRIAFISKYRQLFRIDLASALMTPESLSELYGRPMTVTSYAGEQVIRPVLPPE